MVSNNNREAHDSRFIVASLPARRPLAQAIALAMALGMGSAGAAVFNVTTSADSGPGSLRQAVLDANASPGADQITFDAGLGTIALTSGQIDITETLTVTGPAAGQIIDAGGNSRILAVTVADQPLTLENLTLSGGRTTADGVFRRTCADGTGQVGGICAQDDATLTNSTVSGNSTARIEAHGGGLYVRGNATLTNSTVSGNSTAGDSADGGGFFVFKGDATLTNNTVTANQSAAGAGGIQIMEYFAYGDRPGPIVVSPADLSVTLASTVLAANSGPDGNFNRQIVGPGSVTLNTSNSLFGDDPAEINGINSENVFTDTPGVGPLADNGCAGPAGAPGSAACVQTHALLTGSGAIDAADNTVCADEPVNGIDQSGKPRPADGDDNGIAKCDIGAFERQAAAQSIDYDITGSWYNPATDGQGFSLEVVPASGLLAAYWFTYNLDGGAQMWLQGAGAIDGDVAQVPLERLAGGRFVDPTPPTRSDWGTVTVGFFSDSSGEAIYHSPADGINGVIPIQRITPAIACQDADASSAETIDARFTGSWYDPVTDGQGFSLEVIPDANILVVYWFTYTVDGPAQMWLQGAGPITGDKATVELQRPVGGEFDDDRDPLRPVWGTMTIGFDTSTSGIVAYDSLLDGVSGTFPIQRITPQAFCE